MLKPDVIVEVGNNWGGSSLALAHFQDLVQHGRIIAIDIDHMKLSDTVIEHKRISWIAQDAVSAYSEFKI